MNIINSLIEKLKGAEIKMAHEKGAFDLFALFMLDVIPEQWDVVAAASWITDENYDASLRYIINCIQPLLSSKELFSISGVVLIDQYNPGLDAVLEAIHVEHGLVEVRDTTFFGLDIKHGFVITSCTRHGCTAKSA
uniref:Uncharacterized protein n=1 Tax=Chlorobium chlorochromatii (strain CaD3) TaxID=340177 RepID=Q3APE4_CHLCH